MHGSKMFGAFGVHLIQQLVRRHNETVQKAFADSAFEINFCPAAREVGFQLVSMKSLNKNNTGHDNKF
jgi:hypothetical protein